MGAFTVANVATKGASVLAIMLLGTILSAGDYAKFGIVYALQSGVAMLALTGLVEVAVGRLKAFATPLRRRVLFTRTAGLFWMTSLLCVLLLTPFVLGALGSAPPAAVMASIILGIVSAYALLQASLLRIEHRNAQSLLLSAGVPLCATAGLIVAAAAGMKLGGLFGLAAAGGAAAYLAVRVAGAGYAGRVPKRQRLRSELPSLAPYFAINLLGWLTGYGMNFAVATLFAPIDVATYTFLFTIASIAQLVASSMNMVLAPRFYQAYNGATADDAERISRTSFRLLAAALGIVGFVTVGAMPWLTSLLSDNLADYGREQLGLALLLAGYIVCIPWWHGQNYYHVAGEGRALMALSIVSGLASLAAWVVAMIILGPIGIYAGFALQLAIRSLWMLRRARRRWPIRPPWFTILGGVALTLSALLLPTPF